MSTVGSAVRETGISLATVFRQPALRRLNLALAGSMIGDWAYATAIAVWAYGIGGASAVGIWATSRLALMAVLAPFAAAMADKYPRRTVMIGCDLARFVLVGAAAIVVQVDGPAAVVFVLATLSPIFGTAFRPAQMALTPSLVETPEELTATNGVASTVESLAFFVGPGAGRVPARRRRRRQRLRGQRADLPAVRHHRLGHPAEDDRRRPRAGHPGRRGRRHRRRGAREGRRGGGALPQGRPRGLPGDLAAPRPASGGDDVLRADGRRRRRGRVRGGHRLRHDRPGRVGARLAGLGARRRRHLRRLPRHRPRRPPPARLRLRVGRRVLGPPAAAHLDLADGRRRLHRDGDHRRRQPRRRRQRLDDPAAPDARRRDGARLRGPGERVDRARWRSARS